MVKINFILKKNILPINYYISLKNKILMIFGKKRILGWYDIEKDDININLANLWIRYREDFEKELIETIIHEEIHSIIEKNFGKRIIHPRIQERFLK